MIGRRDGIPALQVLLGAGSFGILSTLVKLAQKDGFSPYDLACVQFVLGACLGWMIVLARRTAGKQGAAGRTASLPQTVKLMATGTLTGLTGLLYYQALNELSVSMAVMLKFQFAWLGVLLHAAAARRRPGTNQWTAVLLIFAGTALSAGVMEQHAGPKWTLAGVLFGFASAVMFALFLFFGGRIATGVDPYRRSACMVTGAAVMLAVIRPPQVMVDVLGASGLWEWGLLLALFGGVAAPMLIAAGTPKLNSGLASILCAAELPVALIASGLVLGDALLAPQWAGVALILLGIAMSGLSGRRTGTRKRRETNG